MRKKTSSLERSLGGRFQATALVLNGHDPAVEVGPHVDLLVAAGYPQPELVGAGLATTNARSQTHVLDIFLGNAGLHGAVQGIEHRPVAGIGVEGIVPAETLDFD